MTGADDERTRVDRDLQLSAKPRTRRNAPVTVPGCRPAPGSDTGRPL